MRIAFDLDGTLIRLETNFPLENPKYILLHKIFSSEKLREGTTSVIKQLQKERHEVWVYTSSFRSSYYIRRMFWLYGIHLQGIINQATHDRAIQKRIKSQGISSDFSFPSKYPPLFGIDLLVEDSKGVKLEGEQYGFKVLIISGNDSYWGKKILDEVNDEILM